MYLNKIYPEYICSCVIFKINNEFKDYCALISIQFVGSIQGSQAASCHMREVDLCVATMAMSATDGVPGNDEELDRVCEYVLKLFLLNFCFIIYILSLKVVIL